MVLLTFLPAKPTHIEADFKQPSYKVVSGELVNQPIQHIKLTEPSQTELCNCYLFVKNRVKNLPRMMEIIPNSEATIGGVAVEFFNGIKHVSIVTKIDDGGVWVAESNYDHCKAGERYIPYSKYSLVGFWSN